MVPHTWNAEDCDKLELEAWVGHMWKPSHKKEKDTFSLVTFLLRGQNTDKKQCQGGRVYWCLRWRLWSVTAGAWSDWSRQHPQLGNRKRDAYDAKLMVSILVVWGFCLFVLFCFVFSLRPPTTHGVVPSTFWVKSFRNSHKDIQTWVLTVML